jgi:uncharacterized protein YndB with AHSA1/START domain
MSGTTKSATAAGTRPKVALERTYRASVDELWEMWTTKEGLESWWGPAGFRTEVHSIEARPNGKVHYDHIAESPEMVAAMREMGRPALTTLHGRFSEFRPRERLALTQMIDFVPGIEAYESTIMVEFFPSGEWVRMVVTLSPMHDEEFTKLACQGLASQLANLDERFQCQYLSE